MGSLVDFETEHISQDLVESSVIFLELRILDLLISGDNAELLTIRRISPLRDSANNYDVLWPPKRRKRAPRESCTIGSPWRVTTRGVGKTTFSEKSTVSSGAVSKLLPDSP